MYAGGLKVWLARNCWLDFQLMSARMRNGTQFSDSWLSASTSWLKMGSSAASNTSLKSEIVSCATRDTNEEEEGEEQGTNNIQKKGCGEQIKWHKNKCVA